jgi:hypothetical protein
VTWSSVPPSTSTLDNLPKIIPPPAPTIDRIGSIVDFQHQDYDIDEVAETIPITKTINGNRRSRLIIGEIGSKDEETSKGIKQIFCLIYLFFYFFLICR